MKPIYIILLFIASIGNSCSQTPKVDIERSNYYWNKAYRLPMNSRSEAELELILMQQRRFLDTALTLNPASLGTFKLKVESFTQSKKLDSAVMVCNVVLRLYPQNTGWLYWRGKLYKELNLLSLSNKDFAIVKARAQKSLNTFDTLQHKNLDAKFVEAYCVKEMGEEALAKELFKKAKAKFPNDTDLKNAIEKVLSQPHKNPPPVIKYRNNPT